MKYRPNGKTWLVHALAFAFACPFLAGGELVFGMTVSQRSGWTAIDANCDFQR